MADRLDIAVAGAGVGGLAVATLLARSGHRVTLYERFDAPVPVGSGLLLQPTGLAALEHLGEGDAVLALGHRIDHLYGANANGRCVFDIRYDALLPGLCGLAVHRGALHGVLWQALRGSSVRLECGRAIVGASLRSGNRVSPLDEHGRAAPSVDLMIDASGARSSLRPLVTRKPAKPFAYGALWASVPDLGIAPNALTQRYAGARSMVGHLPLGRIVAGGDPMVAFFWSLKPQAHAQWAAGFERWRDEVVHLWPAMTPLIEHLRHPDDLQLARYAQFTARTPYGWGNGPLALLGDAAHTTSPQLGQGANQALLDAVVLSGALDRCAGVAQALASYARARRRHTRFYQSASAALTPFFQSDSMMLGRIRDATFERMTAIPYLRREMLRTLAGLKTGALTASVPAQLLRS